MATADVAARHDLSLASECLAVKRFEIAATCFALLNQPIVAALFVRLLKFSRKRKQDCVSMGTEWVHQTALTL
jgi:hypothetical protein